MAQKEERVFEEGPPRPSPHKKYRKEEREV